MIEKLLENWLDSASERSYQPVFVQLLSARGYHIVHSTRHTVLEYGKDILAIAPDGTGCAYQLKGHPSGRLSLEVFRSEIQPQLIQLISQAIVYPGFPAGPHKSYLVTNGYFEEEVQRAVDDLNRMSYPSKIELISRGHLFSWAKEYGMKLWPSELKDTQIMLELFLADPRDLLPAKKLSSLLAKLLLLGAGDTKTLSKASFNRAVTSAALLTGIVTFHFTEAENHFAVISAWAILAITTIAAGEKHGLALEGAALESFKLAEAAIAESLAQLWKEIDSRTHLVEGNAFADPEVYGWRYTTLIGLLSCLALIDDSSECLDEKERSSLHQWLQQVHSEANLWGEGAVASIAPWLVWLRRKDATLRPDYEIANLTTTIILRNQHNKMNHLAGPYYSFEEIARFNMALNKAGEMNPLSGETFAGNAFTAEALLHLLVRTNLKQKCKMIWPEFTKLAHRSCVPDENWEYCTMHISSGMDVTKIYPNTYKWIDLKEEATQPMTEFIPSELASRPWLLALWWQVAPYRFTTAASHVFVNGILPNWGS